MEPVVITGKARFSTRATSEGHLFSLERQNDRSFVCFNVDEAKVWKTKKSRDKLLRHLVGPPCCHLAMSTRKNHTSPDAFFARTFSSRAFLIFPLIPRLLIGRGGAAPQPTIGMRVRSGGVSSSWGHDRRGAPKPSKIGHCENFLILDFWLQHHQQLHLPETIKRPNSSDAPRLRRLR